MIAAASWVFRGFHIGIAKKLRNESSIAFIIIGGGGIIIFFFFFFQLRKEAWAKDKRCPMTPNVK